jgi:hypothetical protein
LIQVITSNISWFNLLLFDRFSFECHGKKFVCQKSNISNHINASLFKIKYGKRGPTGKNKNITPNFSPTADDDDIDDGDGDGWKFYDGPLYGEQPPDDKQDGLDTAVVEDVDGLLMPPVSSLPCGVT